MDFSWLGGLFHGLLDIFNPLKTLQHWKIWAEMKQWYERFKKWRDWYKEHVLAPMRRMQQLQRQIYNQFMKPILTLVDHIRQLTQIVAIFNKKLADKLNYYFLRIESYLLAPLNKITSRTNALGMAVQSILTPLGYLDRGLLLNSVWRDAGLIKEILHNPFEVQTPKPTAPPMPSLNDAVNSGNQYLLDGTGPYQQDVDQTMLNFKSYLAELGL